MKRLGLFALVLIAAGIFVYFYPLTIQAGNDLTLRIAWPEWHWPNTWFSNYVVFPIGTAVASTIVCILLLRYKSWDEETLKTVINASSVMGYFVFVIFTIYGALFLHYVVFDTDFLSSQYEVGPGEEDVLVNASSFVRVNEPVDLIASSERQFTLTNDSGTVYSSMEQHRPIGWSADQFHVTDEIRETRAITVTGGSPVIFRFKSDRAVKLWTRPISPLLDWVGRIFGVLIVSVVLYFAGGLTFYRSRNKIE